MNTTGQLPARRKRIIVGISGASGVAYAICLMWLLREAGVEIHLVVSNAALLTLSHETDITAKQLREMADVNHDNRNIGAAIASGSFRVDGMIVAPCSVKTLSEIATGCTDSLLSRAADVCLKERKRLVLMFRETPLHIGHIRSMAAVTEAGAIIYPPVPAFYARPQSIDDMVRHSVVRMLDLFDFEMAGIDRWR